MRMGDMVKYNLKFYLKKAGIISLVTFAGLFLFNLVAALIAEKLNGEMMNSGMYTAIFGWAMIFLAKECYNINYKISTANCVSRKTVSLAILITILIYTLFLAAATIGMEHLTHALSDGFEKCVYTPFTAYSLISAADGPELTGVAEYAAVFGSQVLVYLALSAAALLISTLVSRLPNYGIFIMCTALFIGFFSITMYSNRIFRFFYDKFGINIVSAASLVVILLSICVIAFAVHFLIFRRLSFLKAESR